MMNPVEEFLLEKSAMSPEVKAALTMGAITAGTTAATAVGTAQIQAGIQSAHDAVSRSIAFKKMMRDNPDLNKMDGKKTRRYFNTLYNTAPELAKDPFASASWVRRVEEYDYVDPQALSTLAQTGAKLRERRMQTTVPAFQLAQTGVQAGMGEYSRLQDQKYQTKKEIAKGVLGLGKSYLEGRAKARISAEDRAARSTERMQDAIDRAIERREDQAFALNREARDRATAVWESLHSPKARGVRNAQEFRDYMYDMQRRKELEKTPFGFTPEQYERYGESPRPHPFYSGKGPFARGMTAADPAVVKSKYEK